MHQHGANSPSAGGPSLHPEARAIMERIAASGEPPLETLPPEEARRLADNRVAASGLPAEPMTEVRDIVAGEHGAPVPMRFYRPSSAARLPLVIFFHGGGFVVGNLHTHDALCRSIAAASGAALLAVEYRLAPEYRFPAAADDCLAAARWAMARRGDVLGCGTVRFALVGESSGGNLVAVVAQQLASAREVAPALQVMIYPQLDGSTDSDSYRRFSDGFFFTRRKAQYFLNLYRDPAQNPDPRLSPVRAPSLAGLPPALVITAGLDPLLSEAEAYVTRLREAGIAVEYRCFEAWPHGFLFWGETEPARATIALVGERLHQALGLTGQGRL